MASPRLVARGTHSENSTSGSFAFRVQHAQGSNHALVVRLYNRGSLASPTVTYNGDSVSLLIRDGAATGNNARFAALLLLVAPDDGDNTVSVSWGSGTAAVWHCIVEHWCDVDQSTPNGTAVSRNENSTNTGSSLDVGSASGDVVIDAIAAIDGTMTVGAGQTGGAPKFLTPGSTLSYETATGATTTMSWTWSSTSTAVGHVGVALKGAAGGASSPTDATASGNVGNRSIVLGSRTLAEPVGAGATNYIGLGASVEDVGNTSAGRTPWPYAGTALKIGVNVTSNATTSSSTLTLTADGADTAVTLTIPAGTTGWFESTATDGLDGTTALQYKIVNGGGGTLEWDAILFAFEPDDADVTVSLLFAFSAGSSAQAAATTTYYGAQGGRTTSATISANTAWMPFDGNLRNLWVSHSNQTRSFSTTVDTLLNESTTALSLTYLSSDHLLSPDTSAVAVSMGDRVQHRITTGAGTGAFDEEWAQLHLESADGMFAMSTASSQLAPTNATDLYCNVAGDLGSAARTSEAAAQSPAPFAFTALRLWADVSANTLAGTTGDDARVTLRVNGADSALWLRIPRNSGAGVYFEAVTPVSIAAGDLLSLKVRTNTSTGSLTIKGMGVVGVSAGSGASAALAITGASGVFAASASSLANSALSTAGSSGSFLGSASSQATAAAAIGGASGAFSASAGSGTSAALATTSSSGAFAASATTPALAQLAAAGGEGAFAGSAYPLTRAELAAAGASGTLSALASTVATAAMTATGASGAASLLAWSPAHAAGAVNGASGVVSANAGSAGTSALAATGSSGAFAASAAGSAADSWPGALYVPPAEHRTWRAPSEIRQWLPHWR